ncbi:hypothetical protein DUNSADRAFT_33 [Dunaliella salina]|uniref:Uncharacterized protein n=1 Tax=Dunaliella salina TaxID=3046 RepID=A0ABQ7HAN2_DUNSA|nr:hypothetical protein DUNSADRAFT_33 [Dunaliella salina]|eukprot:KAF5843912.1 hypothetical protein DUNSADRAFT_33 [Dunaliella salina]
MSDVMCHGVMYLQGAGRYHDMVYCHAMLLPSCRMVP